MDEEAWQKRLLILLASVACAIMIGYNAFYVPDATMVWTQNSSSSESSAVFAESRTDSGGSAASAPDVGPVVTPSASGRNSGQRVSSATKASGKINLNTASARELMDGLNGIGVTLSARIIEYREQNGTFHSIEEIKNVSGIGEKIFERIRDKITVS